MKNTNVTYQQNSEYGSELTYEIRFGFYKSGYPKIGLYCRDKKLSEMTADYRGDMPDDHVAIALDNEGHIGRLYREGLIATSEPVENIPWGDMRRLGFFPLTFAGIGELGVAALDESIGFNFTGVDLCFLGDSHIEGPGGFKYASGSGGSLYTHKFHATTPHRGDPSFLDYAVEKVEERWGKGRGVGIVIKSCKSRYAPKWKTHKKVRDIILEEMVERHGLNIPEGDNCMDRWDDFKAMLVRNEVPPIHLNSGMWKLDYHHSIGDHFENYDDSYGGIYRYYQCLLLHLVKEEDLQESSVLVHGSVDDVQARQEEEPAKDLNLKNHEWRGREINLYIEAKQPYPNYNPWYDITGYYTCGGEEVQFSQYTFDFFRYCDSAAIDIWEDHDKIVRLLYNAGVITKEKTYTSIGLEKKCICYRLTDQALAYAHREQ